MRRSNSLRLIANRYFAEHTPATRGGSIISDANGTKRLAVMANLLPMKVASPGGVMDMKGAALLGAHDRKRCVRIDSPPYMLVAALGVLLFRGMGRLLLANAHIHRSPIMWTNSSTLPKCLQVKAQRPTSPHPPSRTSPRGLCLQCFLS